MPLWKRFADCEAQQLSEKGLPPCATGPVAGQLVKLSLGRPLHQPTMLELRAVPDRGWQLPDGTHAPLDQKTKPYALKTVPAYHQLELSYYGLAMSLASLPVADVGYLLPYVPSFGHQNGLVTVDGVTLEVPLSLEEAERWLRFAREVLDLGAPPDYDWLADAADRVLGVTAFPRQWEDCAVCEFVYKAAKYVA